MSLLVASLDFEYSIIREAGEGHPALPMIESRAPVAR